MLDTRGAVFVRVLLLTVLYVLAFGLMLRHVQRTARRRLQPTAARLFRFIFHFFVMVAAPPAAARGGPHRVMLIIMER